MKGLYLIALFVGCFMLLTIPEAVEAQAGSYHGGGWGRRCYCARHCYYPSQIRGRCGWGRYRCCRRRYGIGY